MPAMGCIFVGGVLPFIRRAGVRGVQEESAMDGLVGRDPARTVRPADLLLVGTADRGGRDVLLFPLHVPVKINPNEVTRSIHVTGGS